MGGTPTRLELTSEPPGGAPYLVSVEQVLHPTMAASLTAGSRVTVKVDPADATSVMLWAATEQEASRAAVPSAPEDRIERLTRLQELRERSVLTEEEFAEQKAKLLSS